MVTCRDAHAGHRELPRLAGALSTCFCIGEALRDRSRRSRTPIYSRASSSCVLAAIADRAVAGPPAGGGCATTTSLLYLLIAIVATMMFIDRPV